MDARAGTKVTGGTTRANLAELLPRAREIGKREQKPNPDYS